MSITNVSGSPSGSLPERWIGSGTSSSVTSAIPDCAVRADVFGGSFTGTTVMLTVATEEKSEPSETLKVNESDPLRSEQRAPRLRREARRLRRIVHWHHRDADRRHRGEERAVGDLEGERVGPVEIGTARAPTAP